MKKWITLTLATLIMGCGSDDSTLSQVVQQALPPNAVADSFAVMGNSQLTGSVTANDQVNGAVVSTYQNPSNAGGSVAITMAGQLTYTPPAGLANQRDTFSYTLSNSAGNSTTTVTVQITAAGFFVKNDVALTGIGSQANPFKTLVEATRAASGINGAQIVLFRGDGTTTGQTGAVTLGVDQGISSLDSANQASISGPVILSSGNSVKDLRILNTAGTAIQGTNAVGGSLSGVTMANATGPGCALVNATGSFTAKNCSLQNMGSHGFIASADSSSLVWSVSGTTFANITGGCAGTNITNTASQNITVSNCSSTGGSYKFLIVEADTAGTSASLTMSNNTVTGNRTVSRGLDVFLHGNTNFLGLVSANNITGCFGEGMLIGIEDNAIARMRFSANKTLGNLQNQGVAIANLGASNPNAGFIFTRNISDNFILIQGRIGTFQVEQFAQFNAISGNIGLVETAGTIQDVPDGSLGIIAQKLSILLALAIDMLNSLRPIP